MFVVDGIAQEEDESFKIDLEFDGIAEPVGESFFFLKTKFLTIIDNDSKRSCNDSNGTVSCFTYHYRLFSVCVCACVCLCVHVYVQMWTCACPCIYTCVWVRTTIMLMAVWSLLLSATCAVGTLSCANGECICKPEYLSPNCCDCVDGYFKDENGVCQRK